MSDSLKCLEEAGTLMEGTLQEGEDSVDKCNGDSVNCINDTTNTQASPIQVNTDRPCTAHTAILEPTSDEILMESNQNEEKGVNQPDIRHLEGQHLQYKKSGNKWEETKEVDRGKKTTVEEKEHQICQEEAGGRLGGGETIQQDPEGGQEQCDFKDPKVCVKNTTGQQQQQRSGQEKQPEMMRNEDLTFRQKVDREVEKENTEHKQEEGEELKKDVEEEKCKDSQEQRKKKHPEENDQDLASRQELDRELEKEGTGQDLVETNLVKIVDKEEDSQEEQEDGPVLALPQEADRGSEEVKSEQDENIPKEEDGEQPENHTKKAKHDTEQAASEEHEKMQKENSEAQEMEQEKSEEDEESQAGEQQQEEKKKKRSLEETVITSEEHEKMQKENSEAEEMEPEEDEESQAGEQQQEEKKKKRSLEDTVITSEEHEKMQKENSEAEEMETEEDEESQAGEQQQEEKKKKRSLEETVITSEEHEKMQKENSEAEEMETEEDEESQAGEQQQEEKKKKRSLEETVITSEEHEKMQKENSEAEEMEPEEDEESQAGEQQQEEKKKKRSLEETVIRTTEDLKSDSSTVTPMDIDQTEEKMQVDDVQHSENWLNIVSVKDKDESPMEEVGSESEPNSKDQASKDVPQDFSSCSDRSDKTVENQTSRESKDGLTDLTVQKPVHRVQPVGEVEKKMALPISGSSPVKIKDEPMDEEYEKALVPQAPAGRVKDEPDMTEEFSQKTSDEIKISAVFSVGGNSAPIGSGTGSVGPGPSVKASSSSSAAIPSLCPASSLCVVCSGCKKVLLKGQTAFQRKGCPQLYCSPHCLCSSGATQLVVKPVPKKVCHYCLKEISNPKDVIIAPVDSAGAVKDFCSQKCLSAFNYKRDGANSVLIADQKSTKCSMCQKACGMRHEVNFMGSVHKLCSDSCFNQFRASNKLTMNCCVHCGGYCYSGDGQCPTLLIEGAVKKFCGQSCITSFKKKYTKLVPCTMCRAYRTIGEMVEDMKKNGSRELFCTTACVTAHKVQTVSSSGAALECNNCKQVQVPQYHLAMSDGTIRNFCTFSCVVAFQDAFNKTNSQNQLNVAPLLSAAPPVPKLVPTKPLAVESKASGVLRVPAVTKIPCAQCQRSFFRKPELLDLKGKMYVFCDKACIDEFRRTNYIMAQCVYCKIDKVVKEVKRINNADCSFCSEGCKLLYKHDLAKHWGKQHCRNCLYCSGTAQSVVTSVFGGKKEEFCGNECLSQYTLLFCEVAKCSMCKRTRQMLESVKWLGEMKHFCNLQCLMYFCSVQCSAAALAKTVPKIPLTQGPVPIAPAAPAAANSMAARTPLGVKDATPVIANVISLSSTTNGQPPVMGGAALPGTVPAGVKVMGHASTQTDVVKPPPAPPPRILKNKALLCKPLNQNKGTSCKPNTSDITTQTDEPPPKVIVLPLPVPVFVPVPMHLYTQYTPVGVGLPLPVPVPMFLPTTLDSAEQIVETIQKIKEKIPDNPLEADLIMMAEMVAEDSEREKAVSRGDQNDGFNEDFDLEALPSHVSWEADSVSSATRGGRSSEPEKAPPSKQPTTPTTQESQMDLEADFPLECFELLEQQAQKEKSQANTRLRPRRRGRDGLLQKKRARKREAALPPSVADRPNVSKLHKEYGIQAWKSWIRWRNSQPNMEMPKLGSRSMMLKENLLQCSTAELSYGLCKFISEARRPNGEAYGPDSLYYLCLGIQQHLFDNSRMENIFADLFYAKFSQSITNILKDWKPTILPSGYVHSRVGEEYLWECKQLGAFSPSVLLNTLLYFCTKLFCFRTVAQHRRLSFAHVMRCTRTHNGAKVACLRFYPPVPKDGKGASGPDSDGVPAKRKRGEEEEEVEEEGVVLEMQENTENPLRCPVRLYEFYLSKCSATVKQRNNVFYLRPERSCVPNSPLWFSSMALDDEGLDGMLTRILTVRELHLEMEKSPVAFDSDNHSDSD